MSSSGLIVFSSISSAMEMILSRLFKNLRLSQALFISSTRNYQLVSHAAIKSLLSPPASTCFTSTQNMHQRHRQKIETAKAAYQKRKRRVQEHFDQLTENVFTVPNVLTLSRMAFTPLLGYFIVQDQHTYALGLFAIAAFTDLVSTFC